MDGHHEELGMLACEVLQHFDLCGFRGQIGRAARREARWHDERACCDAIQGSPGLC